MIHRIIKEAILWSNLNFHWSFEFFIQVTHSRAGVHPKNAEEHGTQGISSTAPPPFPCLRFPIFQDPWLRNEVWRYDRRNPNVAAAFESTTHGVSLKSVFLKGTGTGLALACISAGW